MLDNILEGFMLMANFGTLAAAAVGVIAGIITGAIPGLTATMAVAVLVPFTFFVSPIIGIPFLLGVFKGAIYGGSIPAITINTPGTAAAAATTIDGHALAQKGQARRALEMALYACVFGDLFATIILIFAAQILAQVALEFSSPDFTMLLLFSLTMIAAVSGKSMVKGLIAAATGALIGVIGLDPMSGTSRFTFGVPDMMGGISLIPLLIGMFALPEAIIQMERKQKTISPIDGNAGPKLSAKEFFSHWRTLCRSSSIGAFIGALPGMGAEIACWIAYGVSSKRSRRPHEYGKGSMEGVAAAESAANATCPACLVPMLAFAIPGDTVTAILLGAFMAHNINPGPLLFQQHGELIYALFAVLIVSNLMLLVFGRVAIRWLRNIGFVPNGLLLPSVIALCFAGSFAVNSSYFDMVVTLIGGVVGVLMRKMNVPVAPLIISLLLAPSLEQNIRQSLAFSDGSLGIFVTRPIAAGLLLLTVLSIAGFAWSQIRQSKSTSDLESTVEEQGGKAV